MSIQIADADDADGVDADGVDADIDGDGAGDGGDIQGGNWWNPCTFDYRHGNLGESPFSHRIMLHLFHIFYKIYPNRTDLDLFYQMTLFVFSKL